MNTIEPWAKLGSAPLGDFGIFTIRSDRKVSPRTRRAHDFFVIECVDWVNVIALTPAQELVMVEQFRHGSNTVELEIPGGMMDAEDPSPEAAAQRELREETGYEGQNPRLLGRVFPNPAIMTNVCFTILVENCRCLHAPELDGTEDLLTRLVPVAEIPALMTAGKIRHSLVAAALYHFDLYRRGAGGCP
jgi:8-oxo-dGTP pyrophosphatase MutT (NUDIX family)